MNRKHPRLLLLNAGVALLAAGSIHAQTTTYNGATGKFNIDTWGDPLNWDNGIPSGATDVVIDAGQHVSILAVPTAWNGDLTVKAGAILEMGNSSSLTMHNGIFGSVGTMTIEAGSTTLLRTGSNTTDTYNLHVAGDAVWAIGTSTSAHGRLRTLAGNITGSANLGIKTTNRQALFLSGDNSGFLGTFYIGDNDGAGFGDNLAENNRSALVADSAQALPDLLQVGDGINMRVNVDNTIDTLNIFGVPSDQQGNNKLILNADLNVSSIMIDGVALPPGAYDINSGLTDVNGNAFIAGSGTLNNIGIGFPRLTLRVDPVTGQATLVGDDTVAISINYLEVQSAGNSLDSTGWNSLADQDFDGNGPPNGSGDGWEEAGGSGPHSLGEGYLLGSSVIPATAEIDLGTAYNPAIDAQDLVLIYRTELNQIIEGTVQYVTAAIPGDFDGDGDVDGVDVATMFSNFNGPGGGVPAIAATDLDGDGDADGVDVATLFSLFTGPLAPANVPEPTSLALMGSALLLCVRRRR